MTGGDLFLLEMNSKAALNDVSALDEISSE